MLNMAFQQLERDIQTSPDDLEYLKGRITRYMDICNGALARIREFLEPTIYSDSSDDEGECVVEVIRHFDIATRFKKEEEEDKTQ